MRFPAFIAIAAVATVAVPVNAQPAYETGSGLITPFTPRYATVESATPRIDGASPIAPAVSASGLALDATALLRSSYGLDEAGDGPAKRSYLPVLYSLLIPGAGEIALGYTYRGIALIAVEAVAWSGYAYYRDQGLDDRAAYEAYADRYWDYDRWISQHSATEQMINSGQYTAPVSFEELDQYGRTTWGSQWPGYHTYAPKESQKQNYYENIGKYDWFISGWEDWELATKPRDTDLRTEYRKMRIESNDNLDTADRFIYLSIGARVFSLLETYFLIRSHNQSVETGSIEKVDERRYAFSARSTGITSGEFALEWRF